MPIKSSSVSNICSGIFAVWRCLGVGFQVVVMMMIVVIVMVGKFRLEHLFDSNIHCEGD